jgi:glutamine cyclotransferase
VAWIVGCGACVCLGMLAFALVWQSASATGTTTPTDTATGAGPAVADAGATTTDSTPQPPAEMQVPYYRYRVVKVYPHDSEDFTQGLVYSDGFLYEGTGLYGRSTLTKRPFSTKTSDPNSPPDAAPAGYELGPIVKKTRLPDKYFGEGITLLGDKIIQLTWRSRIGFVYDKETLRQIETFTYDTQGWGLTHDGKRLILSDGTATIRFLDPNTYAEIGQLSVRDQRRPIRQINELEYIDGKIYANIWPTDYIAIISPQDGRVTGWIDLTGLHTPPPNDDNNVVANGIAYLPETKHLLVTGKHWPRMYEIELVPQTNTPRTP